MKLLTLLTTLLLGSTAPAQEVEVDERYPDYAPTTGVSGTIQYLVFTMVEEALEGLSQR